MSGFMTSIKRESNNLNCLLLVLILGDNLKTNIRKQTKNYWLKNIINRKLHFMISMVTLRLIYILMQQILLIAVELKAYICANYTGNTKFVYWAEQCKLICLNGGREFNSRPKAFNFFVIFSNIWCRFKKFQPFFK